MAGANDERLAQALTKLGVLDGTQLALAKSEQAKSGTNLIQTLLRLGMVTAIDIARAAESVADEAPPAAPLMAEESAAPDVPVAPPAPQAGPTQPAPRPSTSGSRPPHSSAKASLASYEVDPEALADVPRSVAEQYLVLPIQMSEDRIIVAMADATNVFAMDEVRTRTGRRVEPIEVDEDELRHAIDQYYSTRARAHVRVSATARDIHENVSGLEAVAGADKSLVDMLDQAPVVRILESILSEAVRMRASDIHVEPRAEDLQIRYRIDGQLMTITRLPKDMQRFVLSRIKILAGEDIAESRLPQDGRFETVVDDRPIDLRVSTLPTFWGEKAVMRILDKSRTLVSLAQLGFMPHTLNGFEELIRQPQGMILVTGPTGSGKSTTLYASLHTINDDKTNITTIEDPIEYEVDGLNQIQVHPQIELTFSVALRHILRQDPDVILIGEIRDFETAEQAFRAALTGHLCLSTLHTNDAPSAATRLVDMGIEPFIVSASVIGILAQRLVRRLCTRCKEAYEPVEKELAQLQLTPEQAARIQFHRGRGCQYCRNSGYTGRVALYELMTVNNEIRDGISQHLPAQQLRTLALRNGMKSMRYDGLMKVNTGVTSAAEVLRVMFASD